MKDAVLKTIKELGPVKAGNIAHSIGVDSANIVEELRELRAEGFITLKNGRYHADVELPAAIKALDELEGKLSAKVEPVSEPLLKYAVLNRLSALLHDDISAVLESIADDLEEYQKLGSV